MITSRTGKEEFTDDEWMGKKGLTLFELSNEDICKVGRGLLRSLYVGISQKGIGSIFMLAYQLKAPGGDPNRRVFDEVFSERMISDEDVLLDNLEETPMQSLNVNPTLFEDANMVSCAQAYAFVAASLLRLFTKPPENYAKAWNHIKSKFSTFYSLPFPLYAGVPHMEVLRTIHQRFSVSELFKRTLYRILYVSNSDQSNQSIKSFLYDTHLAHTGMHILPLFTKLLLVFNIDAGTLLTYLKYKEFERQLTAITKVLRLMANEDRKHTRQMWRYGRIFDQTFFPALQTRQCPKLAYILAYTYQQERPEGNERILEIKQLEDISEPDKKRCALVGEALRKMIRISLPGLHQN